MDRMKMAKTNKACGLCNNVIAFHDGIKGKNSDITKLLFVLNCPDKRILQKALPGFDDYETALFSTKTGLELNNIIDYCSLTFDDVYITNIFKCVFSSDKKPSEYEYKRCHDNVFKKQVESFMPKKIVVFGGSPYRAMFPNLAAEYVSDDLYGRYGFYNDSFPVLIMPHPSRIWAYLDKHKRERFYDKINGFIKGNNLTKL